MILSGKEPRNDREYARIPVRLGARFRLLEPDEASEVSKEILTAPTVWAPSGEAEIRNLASSAKAGPQGLLAAAILEIAEQLVVLRAAVLDQGGPMQAATLGELSGGGGQLTTELLLAQETKVDLRLDDPGSDAPPLRAVAEIVHRYGPPSGRYGFRFAAIHPSDRDRLIRYLYQLQRRALRNAHRVKGEAGGPIGSL